MGGSQKNELSKEQKFMNELYFEYERLMFFVAKQYASNLYEQEEIVQNALVQLLQKGDTLQKLEPNARASYIAVTLRNTAINYRRKLEREQQRQVSLETVPEATEELQFPPADTFLFRAENKRELLRAYEKLPEEDRYLLPGKMPRQLRCKPSSIRIKLTRAGRRRFALLTDEVAEAEETKLLEENKQLYSSIAGAISNPTWIFKVLPPAAGLRQGARFFLF